MAHMIIRHKVEDYGKWKAVFDAHSTTRKAGGCRGGHLFRNADNPNELIIVWDWDTLENARKFAASPDLREVMGKAGVSDRPDVYFLEEVERLAV